MAEKWLETCVWSPFRRDVWNGWLQTPVSRPYQPFQWLLNLSEARRVSGLFDSVASQARLDQNHIRLGGVETASGRRLRLICPSKALQYWGNYTAAAMRNSTFLWFVILSCVNCYYRLFEGYDIGHWHMCEIDYRSQTQLRSISCLTHFTREARLGGNGNKLFGSFDILWVMSDWVPSGMEISRVHSIRISWDIFKAGFHGW